MTSIGAGNVDLVLDGQTVTLRPTLRAAQMLSKQSGGLMSAVQAVARLDIEVVTSVIAMGLNITRPNDINDLAEKVWSTGVVELVEPVTKFLTILANGGRSVEATGGSGEPNPPGN